MLLWTVAFVVQKPPAHRGDIRDRGLIPVLGRSPGGEPWRPLKYSCLENPMDGVAWRATVRMVAKSQTQLKWLHMWTLGIDLLKSVLSFSAEIYPGVVAGSYGNSIFRFLRTTIVSHSGRTCLYSHQQEQMFPFLHIFANICHFWSLLL